MSPLPLKGIRILDLTHSWAGPHSTRILGDFGAEVIRVEYVKRLCLLRGGKVEGKAYDNLPGWLQVNRNKYSITLDLSVEEECEILRSLVKISDVFVENGRPGVIDKLGFGYQKLIEISPDIIMLSMSAFGNSGPYESYAGYGATIEALSGIQILTAYEKGQRPCRIKEIDIINGCFAAGAIMTALLHRQKTGRGQYVDLSQMEAATHALIGDHLLEYSMNKSQTSPIGNRHFRFAPQGCYPCSGIDKWVTITVRSDHEWKKLCEALGHNEWQTNPKFASRSERMRNHRELDRLIQEWTVNHTHIEAMAILQSYGIASGAVLNAGELHGDLHLKERDYFVAKVVGSDKPFMGVPFKLSTGCASSCRRGPKLGEHNEYISREVMGHSGNKMRSFDESEVGTAYDPD